jgi:hypothetical protein
MGASKLLTTTAATADAATAATPVAAAAVVTHPRRFDVFKRQRALRHLPHGADLPSAAARPSTHGCGKALAEAVAVQRPAVGAAAATAASPLGRRPAPQACGIELPLRPRPATGGGDAGCSGGCATPGRLIVLVIVSAGSSTDPAHRAEASLGAYSGLLSRPACRCCPRRGSRRR